MTKEIKEEQKTSIKLDEYYSIEIDVFSWNLIYQINRGKSPSTGKDIIYRQPAYHANLAWALQDYLHKSLKESKSLDEILERIGIVEKRIEELFLEIKKEEI